MRILSFITAFTLILSISLVSGEGLLQTGSIAGGVVGGLAFLALLITAFWFWHRRQIRRRSGGIALPTHADPEKRTTTVTFATPDDNPTSSNSAAAKNRRTMASIASTIFTSQPRGSNVIPIHLSPQLPSNATMPTPNIPSSHIHTANLVPVSTSTTSSPQLQLDLPQTFFSADDLLRVSYASSQKSGRESIGTTRTRDTAMVVPVPAAVSANGGVGGVGAAKARLMTLPGKSASKRDLTTPKGGSGLASTWEDSEEEEEEGGDPFAEEEEEDSDDDDDEEEGVIVRARVQQEEKKSPFGDEFSVKEKEL
ncbi:overproduction-induced pheromone-resistant [Saitoella coloradoensis]